MPIRPKSMATVVCALSARSSDSDDSSRSVDSTVISLMVRISVVLPAPNGPGDDDLDRVTAAAAAHGPVGRSSIHHPRAPGRRR